MAVTSDLSEETEAALAAEARARGLPLRQYVSRILTSMVHEGAGTRLSGADRARLWREGLKDLPYTPPLSDEAVSREGIYGGGD